MPYFDYRALDLNLRSQQGRVWARDSSHAQRLLEQRRFQRIFLKPPPPWQTWRERWKTRNAAEESLYCRQLATLLAASVPLVTSLELLLAQPMHVGLMGAYSAVLHSVQSGNSLSASLRRHPDYFDPVYVGLVHVGERSGRLVENLAEVANSLERELLLRAKVKAALTYPLVVSLFSLAVAYLIVQHILPQFINGVFAGSGMVLPWYTQVLVSTTQFLQNPLHLCVGLATLLGLAWQARRYLQTPEGQRQLYEQLLKWPATRAFFGKVLAVRLARLLATGVGAGLSAVESLRLTSQACANSYLSHYLEIACEDLTDGASLARSLRAIPFLPPILTSFVELGEESVGLPPMLTKAAEMMELEVDEVVLSFTQLLEPLLVGALGAFVGFVLIALFVPLYQMLGGIS